MNRYFAEIAPSGCIEGCFGIADFTPTQERIRRLMFGERLMRGGDECFDTAPAVLAFSALFPVFACSLECIGCAGIVDRPGFRALESPYLRWTYDCPQDSGE